MTYTAHPFLQALARKQAWPEVEKHAAAHGWTVRTYLRQVREHLRELAAGCNVYIRVTPNRLEVLRRVGILPTVHDFHPRYANGRTIAELLAFNRAPMYCATYGYLAPAFDQPDWISIYGPLALHVRPSPGMTLAFGDTGMQVPQTWDGVPFEHWEDSEICREVTLLLTAVWNGSPARAEAELFERGEWPGVALPSLVADPLPLSWEWNTGTCPLTVTRQGLKTGDVIEAHSHVRVRRADVISMHVADPELAQRWGKAL